MYVDKYIFTEKYLQSLEKMKQESKGIALSEKHKQTITKDIATDYLWSYYLTSFTWLNIVLTIIQIIILGVSFFTSINDFFQGFLLAIWCVIFINCIIVDIVYFKYKKKLIEVYDLYFSIIEESEK